MRAITVQQPWAWAIVHGGKTVENRGRREPWHTAVGQRIAIHAGKTRDDDGCFDPNVRAAWHAADERVKGLVEEKGTILGTAFVVDLHHSSRCQVHCTPWSQPDAWHIVLDQIEPWSQPVAARGALGLWTVPDA